MGSCADADDVMMANDLNELSNRETSINKKNKEKKKGAEAEIKLLVNSELDQHSISLIRLCYHVNCKRIIH